MNARIDTSARVDAAVRIERSGLSRRDLLTGGALTISFVLLAPGALADAAEAAGGTAAARVLDPKRVDAFLAVNADGTVTLFSGKVDLGQGLRIALRQILAEELGIPVGRINMIEGDTALTPDQGRTSGSAGIQTGGMQIRQAAATARKALIEMAAPKLNAAPADLIAVDGEVRPKAGGAGIAFAALVAGRQFELALDPQAPTKDPGSYTIVGKPLPRPDVPAKVMGSRIYVHDFTVPGMLHARVIRPPGIGAELLSVDEASMAQLPNVRVVRIRNFLAVVAEDEWTCVRALRTLKAQWTDWQGLPVQSELIQSLRNGPFAGQETLLDRKNPDAAQPANAISMKATYYWPIHTHGSMGPSCAVADVKSDGATIWSASQGTHGNQTSFARFLGMPKDKVRLIYMEGSGCYGMNGHEDAAADAALLSRAVGRPVRVQWMREDEHGWDPKGPPQLIDLSGAIDAQGNLSDWHTDLWLPQSTAGLPNTPLIGPRSAGIEQPLGISTGLLSQNGDAPYNPKNVQVVVHWLKDTPLRPAPIRSPGKPGNCFAVESFVDELAAAVKLDPLAVRLKGLNDPRAVAVLKRAAEMMNWQPRPSPAPTTRDPIARGRGIAYIRYKNAETYVATGMEVAVDRRSGRIQVERVVCAHDCGQIINPDGVRSQVEGAILQTLSRALLEEIRFDRSRVTTVNWASYPILRFSQVPKVEVALIDRPSEKPVGAGEAACAPVAAALGNAVFDAIGVRLRAVPLTAERVKAALNKS
jgi:CO/xanthine dehydrogenase Mo-binding subunit